MPAARTVVRLVLGGLLVVLLIGGVLAVSRQVDGGRSNAFTVADQEAVEADVDHRVVEVKGALLGSGVVWSSTSVRGSAPAVNSWASWCGPCRAGQPSLTTVARRYRGRGVRPLGINVRDSQASAEGHVDEFKVPFPSLFDPAGVNAARLQAFALPSTFILDRDEVVAYRLTGKTTVPILSARLEALLARGGRWAG